MKNALKVQKSKLSLSQWITSGPKSQGEYTAARLTLSALSTEYGVSRLGIPNKVVPMGDLMRLVEQLRGSADFQEGASVVLADLLYEAGSNMARAEGFAGVDAVRGILHLRTDSAYRHVAIVESDGSLVNENSLRPSTTAWSLIDKHRLPVSIIVNRGEALLVGTESSFELADGVSVIPIDPSRSIQALGKRATTHLLALPITGLQGSLEGMVSLEFRCIAIDRELNWEVLVPKLQIRLIVGSPHLLALPAPAEPLDLPKVLPVPSKWFSDKATLLKVFASQKQTVLITGPTGSGKTHLAQWIHSNSPQRGGNFVEAHLNQMTDDVGLPHLFGWTKGAYTGAQTSNEGWAPQAQGGTFFLDEIDTLSIKQQQGLLGFLDTGRFTVMGSGETKQLTDVRFIVATNADLRTMVDEGLFRADLYHRINTLVIDIPPIKERRDEIPAWARHFGNVHAETMDPPNRVLFTSDAITILAQQAFPGNLREVRRAVVNACAYAQADSSFTNDGLVVDRRHLEEVLGMARLSSRGDSVSLLHRSAQVLVDEALGHPDGRVHESVLRHKGLLFDMVWLVAVQTVGDSALGSDKSARRAVARMMDKEVSLRGNNYGTELRKSFARLAEFYGDHACELPEELKRVLKLETEIQPTNL